MGNHRLQVFPIRELVFTEVPQDEPKFATYKAKWDESYRKRWGIKNQFAEGLDSGLVSRIERVCKRIYHLLVIDGYARMDLRLTPTQEIVFIEANPNPILAMEEDFAQSALKAGIPYPKLIQKILELGKSAVRE
jgi:D-alanine-D-alanine ligase